MCTSITWTNGDHYFGRNLDWYVFYPADVVITPHNYKFKWTNGGETDKHHAVMGFAMPVNNYPLYFDGINDVGLAMAGLNDRNAYYPEPQEGKTNITTFEFIPYILSQCATVEEAKKILENAVITNQPFSEQFPVSPMHWTIADKDSSIVIECTKDGKCNVYDNPVGCFTNAPSFPYQLENLKFYRNVTPSVEGFPFDPKDADLFPIYGTGNGTMGLPGGVDSVSRFVRTAYTLLNSEADQTEDASVGQFFHILQNAGQVAGESRFQGHLEVTQYTNCYNTTKQIIYYDTYTNQSLNAVDMTKENLNTEALIVYPVKRDLEVNFQN